MSNNSKGILTFILGTAVGVTAGLYLNSENGKKVRSQTKKKLSKMEASIEEKVNKAYDDLKVKINDTASNVKERFNDTSSEVNTASANVKEAASSLKNATKN